MPNWYRWLWSVIREAGVIDAVLSVGPPAISLPAALASYLAGHDIVMPWWAWLIVGPGIALIAFSYAAARKAYLLEQDRQPKIMISDPELIPVLTTQKTLRRFGIKITNISHGAVRGCSVREESLASNIKVTGQLRFFMQAHEVGGLDSPLGHHRFAQKFDLNGYQSKAVILIAQYDPLGGAGEYFQMLYADELTAPAIKFIPRLTHNLTIVVTAENMAFAQKRDFEFGLDHQMHFYMKATGKQIGDVLNGH